MSQILRALECHASMTPDKLAFVSDCRNGEMIGVTYRQLEEKVAYAAAIIESCSAQCVAIHLHNSIDWIVVDLAVMQCQKACVPIPHFFSRQQIVHVLDQAPIDLVIADQDFAFGEHVACINDLYIYSYSRQTAAQGELLPGTAKVTFTSGSTGTPKGVCLSEQGIELVALSLSQQMTRQTSSVHLVALPLSTLLENITGVYVPLLMGVTSVVLKGEQLGLIGSSELDLAQMNHTLALFQPNSMVVTPALLKALFYLAQTQPKWVKQLDFVAVGGANVAAHLLQQAHQLGIPAYEGYGLSEMCSVVAMNTPDRYKFGTCGKPLPHCDIWIADDGELLVKGAQALGYLSQPFDQEWLPTGDIGQVDDEGFLTITGRKKNQIITSFGRNVSPEWLELQAQQWPALNTMFVVGEGDDRLSALVIYPDRDAVSDELAELNATLPDYAQIRQFICSGSLDELISRADCSLFTANGRPIRPALQAYLSQFDKCSVN